MQTANVLLEDGMAGAGMRGARWTGYGTCQKLGDTTLRSPSGPRLAEPWESVPPAAGDAGSFREVIFSLG